MKRSILFLVFLFILFLSSKSYSQSANTSDKIKQVETNLVAPIEIEGDPGFTITEMMAIHKLNGVSIAVIYNYKIDWVKGYGWADAEKKIAVTTQTLFQAASISKSINSVGILKLVQDKKIDLNTDINQYLVSWKFPYDSLSNRRKINVAHLLSHTGGLTVHGFPGYENGKDTIPTLVEILDGQKPAKTAPIRSMYEPGLKSEYSGGGITISQLIVMDVTHQLYDKYMYDNVLKPIGMTSSTYSQPPSGINPELLATGYHEDGKEVPGKYHIYPEQAAAGLWTTPTDLAKYIIETQLAYAGKSEKVLNRETTQIRLTPYLDDSDAALGVFIDNFDGTKYFQHSGSNEGFRCQYYGSLEGGYGVVVMVNSDDGDIIPAIVGSVSKVYGFPGLYHSIIKQKVKVADSVLDKYVGKYEIKPGNILTVIRLGNHLYGLLTGEQRLELFPESQNKFFLKVMFVEFEFIKDEAGEVSKVVIHQNGLHEAKRLK